MISCCNPAMFEIPVSSSEILLRPLRVRSCSLVKVFRLKLERTPVSSIDRLTKLGRFWPLKFASLLFSITRVARFTEVLRYSVSSSFVPRIYNSIKPVRVLFRPNSLTPMESSLTYVRFGVLKLKTFGMPNAAWLLASVSLCNRGKVLSRMSDTLVPSITKSVSCGMILLMKLSNSGELWTVSSAKLVKVVPVIPP